MLMKKAIAIVMSVVFLILAGCGKNGKVEIPEVTGEFKADFLKVGQADAMILRTQNHTVMIDCGEEDDGEEIVGFLNENGIKEVDYLFITHFDKDHVGGAEKVLSEISVKNIIEPNYVGGGDEYKSYSAYLKQNNIETTRLKFSMNFILDDVVFNAYPALKDKYNESDNNYSIVVSAKHGENSFLFAGDAKKARLAELNSQLDLEHTLLKVPHHGRLNSYTKTFLTKVNPKYAVITCSKKNPADSEVLEILDGLNCKIYLTKDGDVQFISDGKNLTPSR